MIAKIWTWRFCLLFIVLAVAVVALGNSKKFTYDQGLLDESTSRIKQKRDTSSLDRPPSKKFLTTINDQFKQVMNRLPNQSQKPLRGRRGLPNLFKRTLANYGMRSRISPKSEVVVEVVDEKASKVLKGDEINRPIVSTDHSGIRRGNVGVTPGNLNNSSMEQSLTEMIIDDDDSGIPLDRNEGHNATLMDKVSSEAKGNTMGNTSSIIEKSFRDSLFLPNKSFEKVSSIKNSSGETLNRATKYNTDNVLNNNKPLSRLHFAKSFSNVKEDDLRTLKKIIRRKNLDTDNKRNRGNLKVDNELPKTRLGKLTEQSFENDNIMTILDNKQTSDQEKDFKISDSVNNSDDIVYDNVDDGKSNERSITGNTNIDKNHDNIKNSFSNKYNYGNNKNNETGDINDSNNSNDNNGSYLNNSVNFVSNINDHNKRPYDGNKLEKLVKSAGSLKKNKKDKSDEEMGHLKQTVHDMLNFKTVTNFTQTNSKGYIASSSSWSHWSTWSACSASCDNGMRTRERQCRSEFKESKCPGLNSQKELCSLRHCPIDGGYTNWTAWSSCSESCGQQSIRMRMRICMNPRPQYGGRDCPGSRFKIRHCAKPACPGESNADRTVSRRKDEMKSKDKHLQTSRDLLDGLKSILQSKTSHLEKVLSADATDSASKLFDAIYQSGETIADSKTSKNTPKIKNTLTEFASNGEKSDNSSVSSFLEANSAVLSDNFSENILDKQTLLKSKLDSLFSNKFSGNESQNIDNSSYDEKVGALSVHLTEANDTADLERLSAFIGKLNDAANGDILNVSSKMSKNGHASKTPTKISNNSRRGKLLTERLGNSRDGERPAEILGKIQDKDLMAEQALASGRVGVKNTRVLPGGYAWKSGQNHEAQLRYESPEKEFVSDSTASETEQQNSSLNAQGSNQTVLARDKTQFHQSGILNVPGSKVERRPSGKSSYRLRNRFEIGQSLAMEEKWRNANTPGTEHVPSTFLKPVPEDKVHNGNVRLSTASISTTVNGIILGVIRPEKDALGENEMYNSSNDKQIQIHENGDWTAWVPCSSSCGPGYKTRNKKVCLKMATSKNYNCSHVKIQTESCGRKACVAKVEPQTQLVQLKNTQSEYVQGLPKHGVLSIAGKIPRVEEEVATGGKHETEIMGLLRQELDADFLPWSEWSDCSLTCGQGGARTRTRKCEGLNKPNCIGVTHESEACLVKDCPVNGGWSSWSAWTPCSQTCGRSLKLRMRKCDNPAPLHGGEMCYGNQGEQMNCDVPDCSVNGQWSLWSVWSTCHVTCGQAVRHRSRSCSNPAPSNKGLPCVGERRQNLHCDLPLCPIDGGFSHWHSWSACHNSCGKNSFRTRYRFCNNPPPSDGGQSCRGSRFQASKCPVNICTAPVNGGFSPWSNWTACSLNCQLGSVKKRTRMCDNPKPLHGGLDCAGYKTEWKNCSIDDCKVDGGLSDWSAWSACSQSCGETAIQSRERFCTRPTPSGGGKNCSGKTFEIKFCENEPCHQDGATQIPSAQNEQQEAPLVQTINDEKEQLLTAKQNGDDAILSNLKRKLIENLKKLAPDLGLSLGSDSTTNAKEKEAENEVGNIGGETKEVGNMMENELGNTGGRAKEVSMNEVEKEPENPDGKVLKAHVSDHGGISKQSETVTELYGDTGGLIRKLDGKLDERGNLKELEEQLKDPGDESKADSVEEIDEMNPIKSCGFNPCRLSKCLSDPFADCLPNSKCDPVFYDSAGNVKKDCSVETTFLTVPANKLCQRDPCEVSMCLNLPMTKCLTSALCRPVYFDDTGNVLNCTGVLTTPVILTCGKDPCVGKLCSIDAQARCFTDYKCKPTFWNLVSKEEVSECKESEFEELEDGQENADARTMTPFSLKKSFDRPWLRLSQDALNEILKHSSTKDIVVPHAKLKHSRGRNKLSTAQLTMSLHKHDNDDDLTSTSDDDTNNFDEDTDAYDNNVSPNKLKQLNSPRKNSIQTLTTFTPGQYQTHGGNGVSVTRDWKPKLKPPADFNGYVESPQVYKVSPLENDRDQNAREFLLHHRNNDPLSDKTLFSKGFSSEESNSEGLTDEALNSERLDSEEKVSFDGLGSGGVHSNILHDLQEGDVRFPSGTQVPNALGDIDRLVKSDEVQAQGPSMGTTHVLSTPSPYDKVLKQDISDLENALRNTEDPIPRESRFSGLASPVIRQDYTTEGEPGLEKENPLSLAELEAGSPRGDIPRVGAGRAIQSEAPARDLIDSQDGHYVPLDSVIDDLRAHIDGENPINGNLGFP